MESSVQDESRLTFSKLLSSRLAKIGSLGAVTAPVLAGSAVLLAVATQIAIATDANIPFVGVGFLVAVGLLGLATITRSRRDSEGVARDGPAIPYRLELVLMLAVFGLAAFFRLYQFSSFPPGLWYDEGIEATDAISLIERDHFRLWFDANFGRPSLYAYLLAASFKIFGYSMFAARIVPVLAGLGAVVAFYFLARRMFGVVPALVSTALLAVSHWAVTFSRVSWGPALQPVVEIAAVFLFVRAVETRDRLMFGLAGLALATGLYTYIAFRMVPVAIVFFGLALAVTRWHLVKENFGGLVIYSMAFLIAAAPLGVFAVTHQDKFLERTSAVNVFREAEREGSLAPLRNNFDASWRMMTIEGDHNGRHNLKGEPMLDHLTAGLFILGLAVSLWSFRDWRFFSLVPWLVLMLVPGVLTIQIENPSAIRAIGAIPPLFLMMGLVVSHVYRSAAETRLGLGLFAVGALAVIGGSAALNYDIVYNRQVNSQHTYDGFEPEFKQVSDIIATEADEKNVLVSHQFLGHPVTAVVAKGKQFRSFTPSENLIFPADDRDVLLILDDRQFGAIPTLRRLYPNLSVEDHVDPFDRVFFTRVTIPAEDVRSLHDVEVTLRRGEGIDGAMLRREAKPVQEETWTAEDISAGGGAVTAVWEGYVWIARYPHEIELRIESSGVSSIEIDGEVVAFGETGAAMEPMALPLGEHRVRLITTVTEPGTTSFLYRGDPNARSPTDAIYGKSVGERGFQVVYHDGDDFSYDPLFVTQFPFAVAAGASGDARAIEYRGLFNAERTGEYGFALHGSTSTQLFVDGVLVVDNAGRHSPRRVEAVFPLDEGDHLIEIQYVLQGAPDWALFVREPGLEWERMDGSQIRPPEEAFVQPARVRLERSGALAEGIELPGFDELHGIAILEDGTIVVGARELLAFVSPDGELLKTISLGAGMDVADIAASEHGLVVLERSSHSLLLLDDAGERIREWTAAFASVAGVTVAGDRAYVASPAQGVVYEVPLRGGEPERVPVSMEDAPVRAAQPSDVAVAQDGTLFITDFEKRTLIISPDGISATQHPAAGGTGVATPRLALSQGFVIATDPMNQRAVIFDESGKQLGAYNFPASTVPVRLLGLAATEDGQVYVAGLNGILYELTLVVPDELR